MDKDQLKIILERMETIQKVADRIDRDLETDRKDLQEVQLRLGTLEGTIRQLKEDISKMPIKMADKVEDAVKPVTKEAHALKVSIENKKEVFFNIIKRPWWKVWG